MIRFTSFPTDFIPLATLPVTESIIPLAFLGVFFAAVLAFGAAFFAAVFTADFAFATVFVATAVAFFTAGLAFALTFWRVVLGVGIGVSYSRAENLGGVATSVWLGESPCVGPQEDDLKASPAFWRAADNKENRPCQ